MRTVTGRIGKSIAVVTLTGLALAGCSREAEPEPEPSPTPTAAESTEAASIIRDEVARDAAPLAELKISVSFADNGDGLTPAAQAEIERIMASPQYAAGGPIMIGGHTDSSGTDAANRRISQRRAEAVRDYLVDQGVAEERMTLVAFGEQNPVEPNANPDGTPNEAGRAANRRVEIVIEVPEGVPQADSAPKTLVEKLADPAD